MNVARQSEQEADLSALKSGFWREPEACGVFGHGRFLRMSRLAQRGTGRVKLTQLGH